MTLRKLIYRGHSMDEQEDGTWIVRAHHNDPPYHLATGELPATDIECMGIIDREKRKQAQQNKGG